MTLYTSLLYSTTPIHCTPLRLHPPLVNTDCNKNGMGQTRSQPESTIPKENNYVHMYICIYIYIYIYIYVHTHRCNTTAIFALDPSGRNSWGVARVPGDLTPRRRDPDRVEACKGAGRAGVHKGGSISKGFRPPFTKYALQHVLYYFTSSKT